MRLAFRRFILNHRGVTVYGIGVLVFVTSLLFRPDEFEPDQSRWKLAVAYAVMAAASAGSFWVWRVVNRRDPATVDVALASSLAPATVGWVAVILWQVPLVTLVGMLSTVLVVSLGLRSATRGQRPNGGGESPLLPVDGRVPSELPTKRERVEWLMVEHGLSWQKAWKLSETESVELAPSPRRIPRGRNLEAQVATAVALGISFVLSLSMTLNAVGNSAADPEGYIMVFGGAGVVGTAVALVIVLVRVALIATEKDAGAQITR